MVLNVAILFWNLNTRNPIFDNQPLVRMLLEKEAQEKVHFSRGRNRDSGDGCMFIIVWLRMYDSERVTATSSNSLRSI
jgi:hypothetical protein